MTDYNQLCFPDYQNSVINLIASILDNFGAKPDHSLLNNEITGNLADRRKLVLLILDGFGDNLYNNYQDSICQILKPYYRGTLSTVFPSTTAAVITSLTTGKTPLEHGAIGWSLYFKEFGRMIDYLPKWDSPTGEKLDDRYDQIYKIVGSENIFSKLKKGNPDINLISLSPKRLSNSGFSVFNTLPARTVKYKTQHDFFCKLKKLLNKDDSDQTFIYAYCTNPDGLEHRYGVFSKEAAEFLSGFCTKLKNLLGRSEGDSSTILLTADHGLIDITDYLYTDDIAELGRNLILPAFPEPRFISLFPKPGRLSEFERELQKLENRFLILPREEFLKKGFLGTGQPHPKLDDFLGSYLLIAKSTWALKSRYLQSDPKKTEFKAHHAGITAAEMTVPLFRIDL